MILNPEKAPTWPYILVLTKCITSELVSSDAVKVLFYS